MPTNNSTTEFAFLTVDIMEIIVCLQILIYSASIAWNNQTPQVEQVQMLE
jgi:hypothetical protein